MLISVKHSCIFKGLGELHTLYWGPLCYASYATFIEKHYFFLNIDRKESNKINTLRANET